MSSNRLWLLPRRALKSSEWTKSMTKRSRSWLTLTFYRQGLKWDGASHNLSTLAASVSSTMCDTEGSRAMNALKRVEYV
eukprot:scaffold280284_cov18-Prasinocladus_malaysianus.AAC.1